MGKLAGKTSSLPTHGKSTCSPHPLEFLVKARAQFAPQFLFHARITSATPLQAIMLLSLRFHNYQSLS